MIPAMWSLLLPCVSPHNVADAWRLKHIWIDISGLLVSLF